ncbi:Nonribosomal peptide synthetase ataP [Exophiala dermatitidis]|uniref:Nonribosomal peptide synthase GliP n=1 Tax=Exophiala dermatitidis (strain ATCC 34100 / CBS 525.76 / NIH/UT8656) TaxID=858893 RepID=H6BS02_EXODN|nr:nonribosomal peptide synthase GliP [Exophiala dermatitidis NIH/UT8656]EHY54830.1 nonribosomal peptide synthase GliP [Exophiala dermatitidis NIH/UT8656]
MASEVELQLLTLVAERLGVELRSLDLSESFTKNGGHSLSALSLSHACKNRGIALSVKDILKAPSLTTLVQQGLSHTTNAKVAPSVTPDSMQGFAPTNRKSSLLPDQYPATEMQMSLIRGTYENPKLNVIYHRQDCSTAALGILKSAWETVVTSEEMFHVEFQLRKETSFWTRRCRPFAWTEITVQTQHDIETETLKPPSFSGIGYAFKAIKAEQSTCSLNNACILFQVHHALIDGYSMERLLQKVTQVVAGLTPAPSPSMLDFLVQKEAYIQKHQNEAVQFWMSKKEIMSKAVSELAFLSSEPANESCETESFFLNDIYTLDLGDFKGEIVAFAREHNITEAALYHGAWGLVMSLLTDSDYVAFGVAMSGRTIPIAGAMDVVGNLATTIPLFIEIKQELTNLEYLRYILLRVAELASVEWAFPDGCYDRRVSSVVSLQFNQKMPHAHARGPSSWTSRMNTEIPISITIELEGVLNFQYSRTQCHRGMIENVSAVYKKMLTSLLRPTHSVGMCLLEAVDLEQQSYLRRLGNCYSALSTNASVHDSLVSLFRGAAARYPEVIAAEKSEQRMTYKELELASDRICLELSRVVKIGDVVCVHADQSLSWLKAIYGVLKCGATYCPMNPNLPTSLQSSNFLTSGAQVYLVPSGDQKGSAPPACQHCLAVDEILAQHEGQDATSSDVTDVDPSSGAYLCFTSGSTGKPKGVLCTHRGLVAFQRDLEVRLFAQPGWKIAQTMSVSFDGSIHEIFSALSYGATLLLPHDCDPFGHLAEADAAIFTPSVAKVLHPADYKRLQKVYLVGEKVTREVCDRWAGEKVVYNMYGPTEATCGATIKRLRVGESITIGVPNSSTRIYILDRHRRLTVPGWIGEVCLAGVQVSKGYVGQPEATRKKFIPDPVCNGLGEYAYCTGDLGYWTDSGEVVLLGRTDRQIKLRGFRVDLDDIEARVAGIPGVSAVAVTNKDDYLVAMVQPSTISIPHLKTLMAEILPIHANPRVVMAVDVFPLTKAGKLDYAKIRDSQLWAPDVASISMNDMELKVAKVWREVLELEDLSKLRPDSHFSALGGHSLHQLRLASALSQEFLRQVPLSLLINNQRLCELARLIPTLEKFVPEPEVVTESSPNPPESLSPIEEWWAERYSQATCTTCFNVSFACEIAPETDRRRLVQSWDTSLARHCILSSRYIPGPTNQGFIRSWHSTRPQAQLVDSVDMTVEINRPFDITQDHLIRVFVSPTHILVVASHIICDLSTMQLLLDEVGSTYAGQPPVQASLPYPAGKLAGRLSPPDDECFWINSLGGSPESLGQGFLTVSGDGHQNKGSSITMKLPTWTVQTMNAFIEGNGITKHQLAMAAVALTLQYAESSIDITIGSPYLNRRSSCDLKTVGLYVQPLPIRVHFPLNDSKLESPQAYVKAVQSASQAAVSHAVPWDNLQRIRVLGFRV